MENKFTQKAVIKVIGVGGGGNNAVNRMINEGVQGVEFIVANTDAQVLSASVASNKIILGEKTSKGLGAGANPEVGKQAALESEAELKEALLGADLIFVAAGMGGGTGTGAAPIIAKIASESGALVIGIVTKPFKFEGKHRNKFADNGLDELKKYVDSIIVISNDRLLEYIGGIPIQDSFREADAILKQGVQTITDLIAVPAVINLDFADVKTVMSKKGNALFGIGIASGEGRAEKAANKAISSSLLEASVNGAKDIIVNITGGPSISLYDAYDAVDIVTQAAANEDVNVVFGISISEQLAATDEIIVTVIATGFDEKAQLQNVKPSSTNFSSKPEISNVKSSREEAIGEVMPTIEQIISPAEEAKFVPQSSRINQVQELKDEDIFGDDDFPTFLK